MNALRNKVQLIGRLGQDPEIVNFDDGNKMAKFSIATDDSYKDKEGQKVERTQWHNVVVRGGLVSVVENYVIKGQEIAVEAGKTYQFSAKVRSEGTTSSWLEVYFGKQDVESAGDEYTDGGAEIFIKSFGDGENCGIDAFNGDIVTVAAGGCPLPEDSLLDANGKVTFTVADLTAEGTIIFVIKAGNWDGNFGAGIFIDDIELIEVK